MSIIQRPDDNDIFNPEVGNSINHQDVKKKFETYRSKAERIIAEYSEAKTVIDLLKEEVKVSQETEKSQRVKIFSLQRRLLSLEEKEKNVHKLSLKQRYNEQAIEKVNGKISDISSMMEEIKTKFENLIRTTAKEMHVIKQNRDLQVTLASKEASYHLYKTDLESKLSEKEQLIQRYTSENEQLQKELITLKSTVEEMKEYWDKEIDLHKKQNAEYVKKIEELEKERKYIFGDYENVSTSQVLSSGKKQCNQNEKETWPDSTVTSVRDEREKKGWFHEMGITPATEITQKQDARSIHTSNSRYTGTSSSASESQKTFQQKPMKFKYPGFGPKQKPQLDFIEPRGDTSLSYSRPQAKKRLYSQNNDPYLN